MINKFKNLFYLRRQYKSNILKKNNLPNNPLDLFGLWLKEAHKKKLCDANAMSIATVDKNNIPYQRTVLLKYFDKKNMIFFTNMKSRKACHLEKNANISLLFYWNILERQVIANGYTKKLSFSQIEKYFKTRPRNSQISCWASKQSQKIDSRFILEKNFFKIKKKFQNYKNIPIPKFWGGYCVKINAIEFWQGRENRLHDRLLYKIKNNIWQISRLSP